MIAASSHLCALMSRRTARAARRSGGVCTFQNMTARPTSSGGRVDSSQCSAFHSFHHLLNHFTVNLTRSIRYGANRSVPNVVGEAGRIHSMHRHHTRIAQSALPVIDNALVRRLDVIVGRLFPESPVGEVRSTLEQRIRNIFIHSRIVVGATRSLNSHFPFPDSFVHGVTVCAGKR